MPIEITRYRTEWTSLFEAERASLEEVLAPWLHQGVHHIGSTSVSGLAAKPIIDIIAGVRDFQEARAAFEPLADIGYRHAPHRPHAH